MKTFITLLSTFALASAVFAANETAYMADRENKKAGRPNCVNIKDNDQAMERAVTQANRNLGFFIAAFQANKPGDKDFGIKKAFVDGNKCEHLWVGNLAFDGHVFHGQIYNQPQDVHNVKRGEVVTVRPEEITDWMFVKNRKLMGGYTTRVLYARLSPEDQAQFDKEADFEIDK